MASRRELVLALAERYRTSSKKDKGRILNECCDFTGYHRKHLMRLFRNGSLSRKKMSSGRQRIYSEAVREALVVIWEAADRLCGKRLKAVLGVYVEVMELHGHLDLAPEIRALLLKVSGSTIDRMLAPMREPTKGRRRRRKPASTSVKKQVPVRTFGDWEDPEPAFFEIDLVAHNGGQVEGSCVHTLTLTDIASGWTECVSLVVREQTLVTVPIDAVREHLPFGILGLDTDNDSVFLNQTMLAYCDGHGLEFTRSRAYQKNDQAWVEQKNGAVVRRFVGHDRLEGLRDTHLLMRLYRDVRLYVNFF